MQSIYSILAGAAEVLVLAGGSAALILAACAIL